MTLYPNLAELIKYYPCHETSVCDYAEIEPEILRAVMNDGEELRYMELVGLSRLYECPVGMLAHHEVIMMDLNRWKHREMAAAVDTLYMQLKYMAKCQGNEKAQGYLKHTDWLQQRYMRAAYENRLSYCHYLGAYEWISMHVAWSKPKPKRGSLVKVYCADTAEMKKGGVI